MGKEIEKVVVGFLGIQIAIAAAKLAGNSVKVYEVNREAFEGARKIEGALISN
jgi:hypothetical protein